MSNDMAREHIVAHHFPNARSEAEAAKLGIWLFLATEVLMFSGLFCAYAAYRMLYADVVKHCQWLLDWKLGALNTAILIFSSLTMALAVRAAQTNQRKNTVTLLLVTLLCGFGFLIVKYFEYSHKIHVGLLPGGYYNPAGFISEFTQKFPQFPKAEVEHFAKYAHMFYGVYFLMTGLHGLHVVIGMGLIVWVLVRANRGDFSGKYFTPVELVGIYWHLVDLIWIYLFPLLYLVGGVK